MMDPRDGVMRHPDDPAVKAWDQRFTEGEIIEIKGCSFRLTGIAEREIRLRPLSEAEANRAAFGDFQEPRNRHERRARERELRKMHG